MIDRVIIYYLFFLPAAFFMMFSSLIVQVFILLFFILLTATLPASDDFFLVALRKFPEYAITNVVIFTLFLLMFDIINFLIFFSFYFSILYIIPIYIFFRLLPLPWMFAKKGGSSFTKCLSKSKKTNWVILAILSFFAIISIYYDFLIVFLLAPASFVVHRSLIEEA